MTFKEFISRFLAGVVATLVVVSAFGCGPGVEPADLVLRNGKIVTVDEANPEAQALAVRGDRLEAVGSDAEIEPYVGPDTEVIDLEGKLAVPGFIEGHGHFMWLGDTKMKLDLGAAESWDEVVAMVAKAAEGVEPGEYIYAFGWHQAKWKIKPEPNVQGFPFHDSLSAVTPDNPVILKHDSGHGTFANAKAMELKGITRETENPEGGAIIKDAEGYPIGMFLENADRLIEPEASAEAGRPLETVDTFPGGESVARHRAALAAQECISKGITSFHDAGASVETIEVFKKLVEEGQMPLRLYVMLSERNDLLPAVLSKYRIIGMGDNHLTVRSIKKVSDGALGAHSAWLLEPYSDFPESTGMSRESVESITETARLAVEHGFQMCVHAIGDRANRETLDIFEAAFSANPEKQDLRWRIEHAQHLHPADIPRFAELGVIAAMQGCHCTSDAPYVLERLGETRAEEGAYVWQKLLESGALVTNGTDTPVEDVNPIANFYATVTRRLADGSVFYPDQRMSREEALKSYTLASAYAAFEEDIKGTLTAGKLADITVLSRDIMTIPEEEILNTEVVYTIVGGKVVYSSSGMER